MVMWQIRKPVDDPWQVPGDEAKTAELLVEVDVLHPLPDHHHITQQEGLHQGDAHGVHIHCCEFATGGRDLQGEIEDQEGCRRAWGNL